MISVVCQGRDKLGPYPATKERAKSPRVGAGLVPALVNHAYIFSLSTSDLPGAYAGRTIGIRDSSRVLCTRGRVNRAQPRPKSAPVSRRSAVVLSRRPNNCVRPSQAIG